MENMEEWRDVPGFEGHYQVSSLGGVRSLDRLAKSDRRSPQRLKGRVLRPGKASNGYFTVALTINGQMRSYTVHELVASAFLGPRPTGFDIDHIDGVRQNNVLGNLRYVSHETNTRNITKANAASGELGVYPNGSGWQAQVVSAGRKHYLGTFRTIAEAAQARRNWETENDHRGFQNAA